MGTSFSRTDDSFLANWWWTIDRRLIAALGVLAITGLVYVFTASPPIAMAKGLGVWHFAFRQVAFVAGAIALLAICSMLAVKGVVRLAGGLLAIGTFLLVAVLVAGDEVNGAVRWLDLMGVRIQPSEFVKPALVVVLARLLATGRGLGALPQAVGLVALVTGLLLAQPDVGMALLAVLLFAALVFLAGLAWRYVLLLAASGIGLALFAYAAFDHVRSRVDQFLAEDSAFQVMRSLEAVEAGGLFGRGPGEGTIKTRLPDSHADFIFAAGAEEFGLLVSLVVVGLFALIVLRSLILAGRVEDRFARLAASGLAILFGTQALINLAVNLDLVPPKGMTLPFVSYGGSSTFALAIAMGMMLALLRRRPGGGRA